MWCDQILSQAQCLIWKVLEKTAHWQTSLHLHPRHLLLAQPCILLHHGGLFGFQDVVCEDPGHGHLNRKLDSPAHGQLQEELAEPQLGQVAAVLQRFLEEVDSSVLASATQDRRGRQEADRVRARAGHQRLRSHPQAMQEGV